MSSDHRSARGQANLVVLCVALVALTTVAGLGVTLADGALAGADREPLQRQAADALADRLVAPDAPTTRRANVLTRSALGSLTVADVERIAPAIDGYAFSLRLDDQPVVRRGDPTAGVTVRRIVLVADESTATTRVDLAATDAVSLPRRTDRIRLRIRPEDGTRVTTVRANDRVVLHDPAGLAGAATVRVSRYDTIRLEFETRREAADASGLDASGTGGSVEATYFPTRTTKAILVVTVDA